MSNQEFYDGNDEEEQEEVEKIEVDSSEATSKKIKKVEKCVFTAFLALVIAATGFVAGWFGHYGSLGKKKRALLWAIDTANEHYIEDVEDDLYDALFAQFHLDAYSAYYPADDYQTIQDQRQGNNKGAGFSVAVDGTSLRVYNVVVNSPAFHAGLKKGMYLLAYGASESELTPYVSYAQSQAAYEQVMSSNDTVCLRCGYAQKGDDAANFTIAKAEYAATYCYYRDNQTAYYFLDDANKKTVLTERENDKLAALADDSAYLCINAFTGKAANEFKECLAKMKERGKKNLILDLRGNGGGYMNVFADIAACMLRDTAAGSKTVAYAEFKSGERLSYSVPSSSFKTYFEEDSKITVLADEGTASASECLIGALIDYGTIGYGDIYLGKSSVMNVAKTYGKGIMQTQYEDGKGNMLKLTSAKIYWPKGNCIHGVGVREGDGEGQNTVHAIIAPQLPASAEDVFLNQLLS